MVGGEEGGVFDGKWVMYGGWRGGWSVWWEVGEEKVCLGMWEIFWR